MMKISIKREQSQAGLSFAEREKFRPQVKNKLLLLLALLLTAATGAWAQTPLLTIEGIDNEDFTSGSKTFDDKVTVTFSNPVYNDGDEDGWYSAGGASLLTVAGTNGYTITSCKFYTSEGTAATGYTIVGESPSVYLYQGHLYTDDSKSVNLGTYGVAKIEVFGTAAATGYTVSMKDNVKDADKWTVKVGDGQAQALPIGGLTGDGSETVTLQYTGRLKVKGVKATSEAAAAEATPALSITSPSVGQVIGSDGKNYAYGSLPSGVTAVAKICYVSGSNGLALALTDEGKMEWSTAIETCAAHTAPFTGGTWKLATQEEWNNMISAAGSYSALHDGFSSVGGTNMQSDFYWSSTEYDSGDALYYDDYNYNPGEWDHDVKESNLYVRACLAFTVEPAAKEPATVTTAPTGAAIVGVGKTTALVSGGAAEGGTMMYKVTTENTKPASTDGFSEAVPTAKDITASGKVYVWYYVKGDDTHSDSEIAATAIEVPVADVVDLSTLTENTELKDGNLVTGTLAGNYKITIADGATVTLDGAVINGTNSSKWAGLTLAGDGTIILSGVNSVKGFYEDYPGIFVPANKTLTIQGDGSLNVSSNGFGAGIGGGYETIACGNITIEGGTINAQGGTDAAGIGGGWSASCGNISITGGTVTATGGKFAAGIGSGSSGSSCGNITITDGVTKVTATAGQSAPNSIGAGWNGSCGTVTIGGNTGAISESPYTYQPSN